MNANELIDELLKIPAADRCKPVAAQTVDGISFDDVVRVENSGAKVCLFTDRYGGEFTEVIILTNRVEYPPEPRYLPDGSFGTFESGYHLDARCEVSVDGVMVYERPTLVLALSQIKGQPMCTLHIRNGRVRRAEFTSPRVASDNPPADNPVARLYARQGRIEVDALNLPAR